MADDATLLRVHSATMSRQCGDRLADAEKGPGVGGFSAGTNRQCVAALNHVLGAERDTEDVIDDSADKTSAAGAGGGLRARSMSYYVSAAACYGRREPHGKRSRRCSAWIPAHYTVLAVLAAGAGSSQRTILRYVGP